jgi:hypothetical protein
LPWGRFHSAQLRDLKSDRVDIPSPSCFAKPCSITSAMPEMQEWIEAARQEPNEIDELNVEF